MPILIDHLPINEPTGSREYGPALIADSITGVHLRLARCTTATPLLWPLGSTHVEGEIHISLDGGVTWEMCCAFGAEGGIVLLHTGLEAPETRLFCTLPGGTARRLKARTVITGGPLVSQVTLEAV